MQTLTFGWKLSFKGNFSVDLHAENNCYLLHSKCTQQPIEKHKDDYRAEESATPFPGSCACEPCSKNTHCDFSFRCAYYTRIH